MVICVDKPIKLIKVLIVDDHESMRDGLEHELCPENGFVVTASVASAADIEKEILKNRPDVVITDVCTKNGASGIDAAEMVANKYPGIKVIVTSGFDEITYMPRAKEVGAHAFAYKYEGLDYYRDLARRVLNGEYIFSKPAAIPLPQGEAPFTDREIEVLRYLCKGMSSQEIADELSISRNTVNRHVENMRLKTGFPSTMELVIYVLSNGWINPNF